LLGVSLLPAAAVVRAVFARFGVMGAVFSLPAAYAVWGATFCLIVIACKRILFATSPIGSFSFFSPTVIRWAFVVQLFTVASQMFVTWVTGTDFIVWWFRMLGAKIGHSVTINTITLYDWDLLEIGDNAFIGGRTSVMGHVGQMGRVTFARTTIGARCTIGQDCSVLAGSRWAMGRSSARGRLRSSARSWRHT
jgi:hypothetical protein